MRFLPQWRLLLLPYRRLEVQGHLSEGLGVGCGRDMASFEAVMKGTPHIGMSPFRHLQGQALSWPLFSSTFGPFLSEPRSVSGVKILLEKYSHASNNYSPLHRRKSILPKAWSALAASSEEIQDVDMLVSVRWENTSRSQRYQSRLSWHQIPVSPHLVI